MLEHHEHPPCLRHWSSKPLAIRTHWTTILYFNFQKSNELKLKNKFCYSADDDGDDGKIQTTSMKRRRTKRRTMTTTKRRRLLVSPTLASRSRLLAHHCYPRQFKFNAWWPCKSGYGAQDECFWRLEDRPGGLS